MFFLVPLSIFLLGFRAWSLCDNKELQANARAGYCSKCGSKNRSCNELLGSLKKSGNVKKRKLPIVKDLGGKFCLHGVCNYACESKIQSCDGFRSERCRGMRPCSQQRRRKFDGGKDEEDNEEGDEEDGEGEERFGEDEGDVIVKLKRELVKEQNLRAWAEMELEKERKAALSAADEAMAKIMLLQNEKGLMEREARQYREMMEQKQAYDREIVENLKWIILNLQEEKMSTEKPVSNGQDD